MAKRHPDKEKLDQYLDSLVPGFPKNIGNRVLGDIMFPKLKAGVKSPMAARLVGALCMTQ